MARDPYKYFRVEARDLLDQVSRAALDLEQAPAAADPAARLLRLAHTLKGAARVVGLRPVAEEAHAIEELLAPLRESAGPAPRERSDALFRSIDAIEARLQELSGAPATAPAASASSAESEMRTVRADVTEMDALMDGLAEARAELDGVRRRLDALQTGRHDGPDGAVDGRSSLARGAARALERVDRQLRQARDAAERLRLISAGELFDSLERTARDIAMAQNKQVAFEGRGHAIRLDAHLFRAIQGALVQLVRNAAAHGVETPDVRAAAGKPREGRIAVEVSRRGRRIAFVCRDDGAGVQVDRLHAAARRRGLPAIDTQDPDAITHLLLRGGLSTTDTITEVSGRGIGLELVREAAERLGGEVKVRTEAGAGTSVEILVLPTAAALRTLLVRATSDAVVAIPLDAVRRTLRIGPGAIARTGEARNIVSHGATLPFAPLAELLGTTASADDRPWTAIVLETEAGAVALGVEGLAGVAEIVLRPLPDLAPPSPLAAGVYIGDGGAPRLVLDPEALVAGAARSRPRTADVAAELPLLIIDDSVTTRMLEKSILELAGYRVDTASSAEEGLERAREARYALFLVDVEMPGMDGFGFIETVRSDPATRDVPAMLVTSCTSPEARQRSQQVGAKGYIVKSEFDQTEFLRTVGHLVSGR